MKKSLNLILFLGAIDIASTQNMFPGAPWSSSGNTNFYTPIASPFAQSSIRMRINANGNSLIGSTSQMKASNALDVNGDVWANKRTVNASEVGYVPNFICNLPPMDSLNRFIKEYHHSPRNSSSEQMKKIV